jgi:hypothetical protein
MKSNCLVKESSKKKILKIYASFTKREKVHLDGKKKPERHKKIVTTENDSIDDEISVQVINSPNKKCQMKSVNISDVIDEESK